MKGTANYMANGLKLCKADDRNNLTTGLIASVFGLGLITYIQYIKLQERNKKIYWLGQSANELSDLNKRQAEANSALAEENKKQQQEIIRLRRANQIMAGKIKEIQKEEPQA